jgi:hypothetical protein
VSDDTVNIPARKRLRLSGRLFAVFAVCVASGFGLAWFMNTSEESEYLKVFPEVRGYYSMPKYSPSSGQSQVLARVEFTFTNPTTHSIRYVGRGNGIAFRIMTRHPLKKFYQGKLSAFPSNIKPPWTPWYEMTSLSWVTNSPLSELKPGESLSFTSGIAAGSSVRLGVVLFQESPGPQSESWTTHWSKKISPSLPRQ